MILEKIPIVVLISTEASPEIMKAKEKNQCCGMGWSNHKSQLNFLEAIENSLGNANRQGLIYLIDQRVYLLTLSMQNLTYSWTILGIKTFIGTKFWCSVWGFLKFSMMTDQSSTHFRRIALTQRNKKSQDETPMCGTSSFCGPINKLLIHGLRNWPFVIKSILNLPRALWKSCHTCFNSVVTTIQKLWMRVCPTTFVLLE